MSKKSLTKKQQAKLPFRRGVGIMLFNKKGQIFVAQRLDTSGAWQMPQGGLDKGEKPKKAALREMKEEIGTDKGKIVGKTRKWLSYDLPPHVVHLVWKGRHRGQKQRWYAVKFTGKDKDINLNHTNRPEFDRWKWVSVDDLVNDIVPFKRKLYKKIVADLKKYVK
ncbi:MAG: RNA pyrophosphohydrolase [Alphaproteobacteria bacterium]|nr:RNA pyrophosphohydrolase [Alphaproteobacteria bacterium]